MKLNENNNVMIVGEIASEFEFNHSVRGEDFYRFVVKSARLSGTDDMIPVLVSDRIFDTSQNLKGIFVSVSGEFRSHNSEIKDGGTRLLLFVFAKKVEIHEETDILMDSYKNHVNFKGYICNPPFYRKTPLGREIADLLLAVNRSHGKSDYIPCICWGRNALYASSLGVGTKVSISGRIQSRTYNKWVSDNEIEERTAYEVSAQSLEVCTE